jgi:tRNA(fMet)-specific endonuclease VapC
LLDTSTYLDILRADRNRDKPWAKNTIAHLIDYRDHHPRLSISCFTAFELLEGIYREPREGAVEEFQRNVLSDFEVIYPDQETIRISAQIHALLRIEGQGIGLVDCLIAATAINERLVLVTSNDKHFSRIQSAGFTLNMSNWRS